jgi:hypothetical protein
MRFLSLAAQPPLMTKRGCMCVHGGGVCMDVCVYGWMYGWVYVCMHGCHVSKYVLCFLACG